MKPQYNAPPGWHLWREKKPMPDKVVMFLRVKQDGGVNFYTCSLSDIEIYKLSQLNYPPIIWRYEQEFAENLLTLIQLPAKILQYMDGNPQTLANLALQIFEDGVALGYESFCPYESDPVHPDEPKCRKLMLKNYFDL